MRSSSARSISSTRSPCNAPGSPIGAPVGSSGGSSGGFISRLIRVGDPDPVHALEEAAPGGGPRDDGHGRAGCVPHGLHGRGFVDPEPGRPRLRLRPSRGWCAARTHAPPRLAGYAPSAGVAKTQPARGHPRHWSTLRHQKRLRRARAPRASCGRRSDAGSQSATCCAPAPRSRPAPSVAQRARRRRQPCRRRGQCGLRAGSGSALGRRPAGRSTAAPPAPEPHRGQPALPAGVPALPAGVPALPAGALAPPAEARAPAPTATSKTKRTAHSLGGNTPSARL